MSDPWRNKYVASRLNDAEAAKTAHTIRLRRDATLAQMGAPPITYAAILTAAIERAKDAALARGLSTSLYGTWSQHNSTKEKVFDQFGNILRDLDLSPAEVREYVKMLDEEWGSGASLYFD